MEYPRTVLVNFTKLDNWFVAKSQDLPGFHVADPEFAVVAESIMPVMCAYYKARFDVDVEVSQENESADDVFPIAYTAKPTSCNITHY